jgi:transcriptional regulator with GAF, ATPase, and Fis domain/tetratricopeptide (TPR) repeat protein
MASDALLGALCERVRGSLAAARHEYDRALEHFARALELDPSDRGESLLGQAQLHYELRRDEEVCALSVPPQVSPRAASLTRTFQAMSHLRLGRIERAREMLDAELEQALAAGDAGRIAGLRLNLGTLERRTGNLAVAIAHFEESVAHCERAGVLTRLAEARSLFAAALREAGELRRAEPLFTSSLAMRERLGDVRGAHVVRGMLGLLYAERGHARAAIETLQRATRGLRASGRRSDAYLLAGRCEETRARIGAAEPMEGGSDRVDEAAEGDPRVLIAAARTLALRGAIDPALELARRAGDLGRALGLAHVRSEARLLAHWLAPERPAAGPTGFPAGSLVEQDERLLELLAEPVWDHDRAAAAADWAAELERRGRDDRAARLWLAAAARARDGATSDAAQARAESLLEVCGAGLTGREAKALRASLLGLPDPWPHELQTRVTTPEESEMELLSLLEINHRLLAQDEISGLLGTIVEQALSVSAAERGFLILEQDGELRIDTAMDSRRGGMDATEVELSGSVLREALRRMAPVRISNALDDPLLGGAPSVVALDLRSVLCVPFEVDASLRGIIYVDHRVREGAFDERSERLLRLLAGQAALAIQQVRRLEEIRSLNAELNRHVVSVESDLRTARKALQTVGLPGPAGGLVGSSQVMRDVHRLVERAAPNKLPVLICGPSGTGKELAARALHDLSHRSQGPFVSENCAALPPTLIEAELFGAKRGAFTGAERDRAGLFERAHGGTLFLDEIGELPIDLQAKLLRVLETSQVRRVGDSVERSVDFRLLAATNRELEREVNEERFRADLFYRLDGLRLRMPSLAAHREDIPELVDHYLRLQTAPGRTPRGISEAVLARLCRRDWPGNVREMFNELARLCVMCEGDLDDPELVRETTLVPAIRADSIRTLADVEREAIERTLELTGGDKRRAAEMLGISRAKIYQRLKEWRKEE